MLDQPQNGSISTNNTEYETSVTYSCDEGFELSAADVVKTCQANKTWSPTEDVTCNSKYYFVLLNPGENYKLTISIEKINKKTFSV